MSLLTKRPASSEGLLVVSSRGVWGRERKGETETENTVYFTLQVNYGSPGQIMKLCIERSKEIALRVHSLLV